MRVCIEIDAPKISPYFVNYNSIQKFFFFASSAELLDDERQSTGEVHGFQRVLGVVREPRCSRAKSGGFRLACRYLVIPFLIEMRARSRLLFSTYIRGKDM